MIEKLRKNSSNNNINDDFEGINEFPKAKGLQPYYKKHNELNNQIEKEKKK